MTSPPQQLCICADDFGLHSGVNAAVLDLAHRGRISATGCMVRRKAWRGGVFGLRRIDRHAVDVGLHLDMSRFGSAEGQDGSPLRLIAAAYARQLDAGAVLAEIHEQLERFEQAMARPPAFVDGHQHVHQLPVVREALVEALAVRYGERMPWLRVTAPPQENRLPRNKQDLVFAFGGRALRGLAQRHGITTSQRLLGVYDFTGDADAYRARLAQWLRECRSGDVLMCHPAADGAADDGIALARQAEYQVLGGAQSIAAMSGCTVVAAPLPHAGGRTAASR